MSDTVEGAENPDNLNKLHIGKVATSAAGIPAIVQSLKHLVEEPGMLRGLKALSAMNQKDGFDCPSCAWPDPDDERSGLGEYCENGAKAVADEATSKKIGRDFFAANAVTKLAALTDHEIGKKGRIAEPLYLPPGGSHYLPISWDGAFQKIADHLNMLASPDETVFYTSGRTSNEAAFLYQLFVRHFGTNNLPDCSNMCHESSGIALTESLGIGKGSVTLDDFNHAEVILILGQNPGTNHPRMLTALQKAKQNGAVIIAINPLPEAGLMGFKHPQQLKGLLGNGTALTDLFLQVKINGDMALLQAICKLLIEADVISPGAVDHGFINAHTTNFDGYSEHIKRSDLDELVQLSGISLKEIQTAVSLIRDKSKIIACWAMGLTQHKNAVDTIKEIVNLLLLKGSIGKQGAGTCPVRGHSNVQGDRTMGIYEKPSKAFLNTLEKNFGFTPPQHDGLDVVNSIRAMHEGRVKVFIAMGGNFLSATPDTTYTATALQKCSLTVHVSTKLNRSHVIHGTEALILPCLSRSDEDKMNGNVQIVSCENSMGVVHLSKGNLKPISDMLLSEPVIVCKIAQYTLQQRSKVNWQHYLESYDNIRSDIERTIPGFNDYNQRVREPGGFYLPNDNRKGIFLTADKKAAFSTSFPENLSIENDELIMMTIRSHDQFNTTIYGLDDRYRGIYNERRVIMMNIADIRAMGFAAGDVIDIVNETEGIRRVATKFIIVPYPISKKCAATYFPETNVLVPITSVADKSNTPVSKAVKIKLLKHQNKSVDIKLCS